MSNAMSTTNTNAATSPEKKFTLHKVIQSVGILPVLILIFIGFSLMTPNFATESNIMNIVRQSSINTVLAPLLGPPDWPA